MQRCLTPLKSLTSRGFHSSAPVYRIYNNVCETIGRTPIIKLNSVAPKGIDMYVKCEYFNPLGSVKDRLAIGIIEHAEKTGALKPGMTVCEATSGNTGIGLAMVCAAKGYNCVITMAESFSIERRKIMRALGAKVVLTPAPLKGTGMVEKARELAETHGYFQSAQFENEANPAYHAQTTGPEILSDFVGRPLDFWVTGYGTGGTMAGAGKVIKQARPDVKIILAEPTDAALITSGKKQERRADGSPKSSHPAFNPHPVQGWTPDFIPDITERGLHIADDMILVKPADGIKMSLRLASEEGLFTGISGGSTVQAAVQVAENAKKGTSILAMLPDTGERYMSTPLFADVAADMNEEEQKLSESTPFAQF